MPFCPSATTPETSAAVTAASTALPPSASTAAAAPTASGIPTAIPDFARVTRYSIILASRSNKLTTEPGTRAAGGSRRERLLKPPMNADERRSDEGGRDPMLLLAYQRAQPSCTSSLL